MSSASTSGAWPSCPSSGYGIADGIAVIGEGEFLFADRGGTLYHYVGGGVTEVRGLPRSRTSGVFGGLLDVSLHPGFPDSRLVYIAYNDAAFGLTVARFELRDDRAERLSLIYQSEEFSIGSRIEWQDPSHFFLSFGVGGDPYPAPGPQDLSADAGKIHRLMADGQIPPDNPILPGALAPSTAGRCPLTASTTTARGYRRCRRTPPAPCPSCRRSSVARAIESHRQAADRRRCGEPEAVGSRADHRVVTGWRSSLSA
jgi:glucose/arabinose dehydrogenase